jgi:hypothetical protein
MPPGGLLRIWPVASLLGRSSIAADTLLPSRLATGQIGSNERMRIYEIDHLEPARVQGGFRTAATAASQKADAPVPGKLPGMT